MAAGHASSGFCPRAQARVPEAGEDPHGAGQPRALPRRCACWELSPGQATVLPVPRRRACWELASPRLCPMHRAAMHAGIGHLSKPVSHRPRRNACWELTSGQATVLPISHRRACWEVALPWVTVHSLPCRSACWEVVCTRGPALALGRGVAWCVCSHGGGLPSSPASVPPPVPGHGRGEEAGAGAQGAPRMHVAAPGVTRRPPPPAAMGGRAPGAHRCQGQGGRVVQWGGKHWGTPQPFYRKI